MGPGIDDQDRPYCYYTPMQDICMRPALPSLLGPAKVITTAAVCYAAPGQALMKLALNMALTRSHKTIYSSICHAISEGLKVAAKTTGDVALTIPSYVGSIGLGIASDFLQARSAILAKEAATRASPTLVRLGEAALATANAMNVIAKPLLACGLVYAGYVLARHAIEPPPYEAPPGCYPNGGPMIEISQEEAPSKSMVFACPAPLARTVQERVLLCERDPTIIQKVKTIAARWCDQNGLSNNQRYAAICGAVAAAMTVPINEQLVLQLGQSHSVQLQHGRLQRYLQGIKHKNDPWWTKYFLIRR